MSKTPTLLKALVVLCAVIFVVAALGGLLYLFDRPGQQGITGSGVTNFSALDVAGAINYGANDLYPVGFASDGQQAIYGTDSITTSATASHGLTTVTFCLCTLGEDAGTGAGDAASCSVAVATNTCTIKLWQDDGTAATEADVAIQWLVIGAP